MGGGGGGRGNNIGDSFILKKYERNLRTAVPSLLSNHNKKYKDLPYNT